MTGHDDPESVAIDEYIRKQLDEASQRYRSLIDFDARLKETFEAGDTEN